MPLGTRTLIGPRWESRNRVTAAGGCTATCTVTRPSTAAGTFDATTGRTTRTAAATVYTGPCRVQVTPRIPQALDFAGEQITPGRYTVSVPLTVSQPVIHVDDVVTVTAASDGSLIGSRLRVSEIMHGSLVWMRDLVCVLDETA